MFLHHFVLAKLATSSVYNGAGVNGRKKIQLFFRENEREKMKIFLLYLESSGKIFKILLLYLERILSFSKQTPEKKSIFFLTFTPAPL